MRRKLQRKHGIPYRLESFKRHCVEQGYDLLPDDYRFIDLMLNDFDPSAFKSILTGYSREWCEGIGKERSCILAQGRGRRRANMWLLEKSEERKNEIKKINQNKRPWDTCFD